MGPEEEPPLLGPVAQGPRLVSSGQRWGDTEWPCRPLSLYLGIALVRPSPPTQPHCSQAGPRLALSEVGAGSAPVLRPAAGEQCCCPLQRSPPVFWSTFSPTPPLPPPVPRLLAPRFRGPQLGCGEKEWRLAGGRIFWGGRKHVGGAQGGGRQARLTPALLKKPDPIGPTTSARTPTLPQKMGVPPPPHLRCLLR